MQFDTTINAWHTVPEHGPHQRVATRARSTCSSTTPPATWRRSTSCTSGGIDGGSTSSRSSDAVDLTILAAGDPGLERQVPDAGDREEQRGLPAARPRLREPRRAPHGERPPLRLRRGSRGGGGDHRAHDGRGVRDERAGRRAHRPVRGLRQEPRAVPRRHPQAREPGRPDRLEPRRAAPARRRARRVGPTRSGSAPSTATGTRRSRCSRRPAPSAS